MFLTPPPPSLLIVVLPFRMFSTSHLLFDLKTDRWNMLIFSSVSLTLHSTALVRDVKRDRIVLKIARRARTKRSDWIEYHRFGDKDWSKKSLLSLLVVILYFYLSTKT